jgi:hypothetical protein
MCTEVNDGLVSVQKNGWGTVHDSLGPTWTPNQRSKVQAVAVSARNAADQVTPLAKQTPNRVVRGIYEQLSSPRAAPTLTACRITPRRQRTRISLSQRRHPARPTPTAGLATRLFSSPISSPEPALRWRSCSVETKSPPARRNLRTSAITVVC